MLCEKPTSTTRADAAALVEIVRATGLVFLGGHVYHFRPDYQRLVPAYQAGDIGKAWMVEGRLRLQLKMMYGPDGRTPWRSDARPPQDIMLGGGCHPMGLMRWVLQEEVTEVTAYSNHMAEPLLPLDDCYVAIMRFAGGAIGRLSAARAAAGRFRTAATSRSAVPRAACGTTSSTATTTSTTRRIRSATSDTRPSTSGPGEHKAQVHYWAEQARTSSTACRERPSR